MKSVESYTLIKAIGELSSDGTFVYDLESNTLEYVNDAMVQIFDISHTSFKHQSTFFLNHIVQEDLDYLKGQYARLKEDSKIENVEFSLRSHAGEIKTITCNAYVVDGIIFGFVRDITMEREHESYIINYGAKKDSLLDMVSHNLSGPLKMSQQILESLQTVSRKQKSEEIDKHIQLIRESTDHCIEIVNDFLEEEHLVSESIFTRKVRFDVVEMLGMMLERVRKSYPERQFLLSCDATSVHITNDEVKLMQVIQNLISNAVKFTRPDGIIEIIVLDTDQVCRITVRDNGIGIPERFKPILFEKYTAAGRKGLKGEDSLGMGLYICKKLTSLLGGRLSFESAENVGSSFTVELPK